MPGMGGPKGHRGFRGKPGSQGEQGPTGEKVNSQPFCEKVYTLEFMS